MKNKRIAAVVASLGLAAMAYTAVPVNAGAAANYTPITGGTYTFDKYLGFEGFPDIIGYACLKATALCRGLFICSQEYYRDLIKPQLVFQGTEPAECLKAVHPRHPDIKQDEVGAVIFYE